MSRFQSLFASSLLLSQLAMLNVTRVQKICNWPRSVSLLGGEAQLAGCLREPEGCPLEWDIGIQ